ncbi:sigma factor [Bradyrhizobium sp. 25ACV]
MGSLAEAQEVVQDAWLRWVGVEDYVDSPPAHLTRIVTRLCPDDARRARAPGSLPGTLAARSSRGFHGARRDGRRRRHGHVDAGPRASVSSGAGRFSSP